MLQLVKLQDALTSAFETPQKTSWDAADRIAKAYVDYSADATAGPAFPVFTGTEQAALAAVFVQALAAPETGSAVSAAAALANAVRSFWSAPPIVFSAGETGGAVAAMLGLEASLVASFATPSASARQVAAAMAAVLDAATRTVVVTLLPSGTVWTLL